MNEREVGQAYYSILQSIKDEINMSLSVSGIENGLSEDQIRIIIHSAQSSVDKIGGNAFNMLLKTFK